MNRFNKMKKAVLSLSVVGTAISLASNAHAALEADSIDVSDAISNIELVGLAVIGVVIVRYGIKIATRMFG